jgi:hypothetical protein
MSRLHAQVHNVCHVGVHVLPSAVLHADTQMASWLERTECVSWFHNIKSDYSSKKVLTGIWKGTGMVELSF